MEAESWELEAGSFSSYVHLLTSYYFNISFILFVFCISSNKRLLIKLLQNKICCYKFITYSSKVIISWFLFFLFGLKFDKRFYFFIKILHYYLLLFQIVKCVNRSSKYFEKLWCSKSARQCFFFYQKRRNRWFSWSKWCGKIYFNENFNHLYPC